ncbi:hypothetical protein DEU56DRAFT_982635 [Suillus clintonianus]|uniref:uncharacterized protein n=1 Tax=Suillus clintonianus TaxID=1904413 RepID=UPI001B88450C|nr:uncharacterized protein DEU56DRAFT_982635 [Suillus clintonianus]KAG2127976.1 hypothetical protein DEU56DRAFT_982635 [Suillus clintonianus]
MHHALLVDDIVHAILTHVTSTDIFNFARTCSAVSDPALDILWSEQSSLVPLIRCLPRDTWEVGKDNYIYLCHEPLPMEWERIKMNASRIRRLIPNSNRTSYPKLHISVLHQLFASFPPTSIFPNLCALHFEAVSNLLECRSDLSLLRQFLSPALELLSFDVPSGVLADELDRLVAALPEASGLRQLSISVDPSPHGSHLTLPLQNMQKLNVLSMDGVDACPMMHNISNLQHLRHLHSLVLTLQEGSGGMEKLPSGDMPLELSTLKSFVLYADRIQRCTHFLLRVVTPQLSSISIKYHKHALQEEVREFVLSLPTYCQTFASLEEISVGSLSAWEPHPGSTLPSDIFRPLLKFRKLAIVNFIEVGRYRLDDAFIEDAAAAWADLRELRFASNQTDTSTVRVTLTGILSLASRCRSLRILHLTFNATAFPTFPHAADGRPEFWPTQTALQKLHVGHSKVAADAYVPFWLAVVFPNLGDLTWYEAPGNTMWLALADVRKKLVIVQEVAPAMTEASLPSYLLRSIMAEGLRVGA